MKIESLKVFCDLAESQSFTKAAQINEVTQSAVSQQITSLEHTFHSLLIERGKHKFRLTPHGQLLYDFSKQILETVAGLGRTLRETQEIVSGTIRISTICSIGLHDLPPYLKQFLKSYPATKVHVEYRQASQIYEDVLDNVADLGLVAYPTQGRNLEIVPLRQEPMVLICHPQHPLAKRKSIKIKALSGQKLIGLERDIPTRRAMDRLLRSNHVTVERAMEFDNVETVKRAVEIDYGVAVVPQSTIAREVADQTLAAVPFEDGGISRPLAAVHTRTKVLSPAMNKLVDLMKEPLGNGQVD